MYPAVIGCQKEKQLQNYHSMVKAEWVCSSVKVQKDDLCLEIRVSLLLAQRTNGNESFNEEFSLITFIE